MIPIGVLGQLASCAISDGDNVVDGFSQTEQQGALASSKIWSKRHIDVCAETVKSTEINWVREIIDATWGAESGLQFRWFTTRRCAFVPEDRRDIRINFATGCTGFQVEGIGTELDNYPYGMTLSLCENLDPESRKKQLQWASVHEFGHALAFIHEHARPDATSCQGQIDYQNPGLGDTFVGAYDVDSTMNYCSGSGIGLGNNYGRLSGTDIQSIANYYGAAFPFAAVNQEPGKVDLFARRTHPVAPQIEGGSVGVRTYTSGVGWTGWLELGSFDNHAPTSAPAAVAWDSTRVDVFVRTSTAKIAHIARNGSTWTGWSDLGGDIVGQPVAVSRGVNRLTVLARGRICTPGAACEYGLSVREWDGSSWGTSWINIPNPSGLYGEQHFVGRPAAVIDAAGAVNVFVQWSDRSLRTIRSTAPNLWPTTWTNLGMTILSSPAPVLIKGTSTIAVFVRGTDGKIYSRERDANLVWSGAIDHGFPPTGTSGSPSVVSRDWGFIDLVVREPAYGEIWHRQRNNIVGWGDWQRLPTGFPTAASPYIVASSPSWVHIFTVDDVWYDFPVENIQWQYSTGWTYFLMDGATVY